MRHRYIFCGLVHPTDPISNFRLIKSCRKYNTGEFIRVNIPDDLKLDHFPYDGYSTTNDTRTLEELGYDCYICFEGRWRKFNELKAHIPADWHEVLEEKYGVIMYGPFYYTDSEEKAEAWENEHEFIPEDKIVFPPFREDKNGLKLKCK